MKNKLEALLFSAAKPISEEEIIKILNISKEDLKKLIEELKQDLIKRDSPFEIENVDGSLQIAVKKEFSKILKKIASIPELPQSLLKTLAVIANLAPVKQSEVIKKRNNKAYGHIKELENKGFITTQKSGKTRIINLAPKFFEYFSTNPKQIKNRLEKAEKKIYLIDTLGHKRPLETYDKLGELEIYEAEKPEIKIEKPKEEIEIPEVLKEKEDVPKAEIAREHKEAPETIFPKGITSEIKEKIEKRIKEIISGEAAKEEKTE